ncbi:MAG TPA: diacylglycerol kinase family protein [Saprospiraceae bacterium]|nr:diacylglycerol kinase family protein [Saprospiraceae bacterium]HRG22161.1 diacylglycerol kinase family protein [Saprospiraceae bacterium]HRG65950.1 diacylglycerol kinase family protein [Saprospiraceae bacterium]
MDSFKYALEGLFVMFKEERNARIHLIMAIGSIVAGVYFNLSLSEWIFLVFAIGLVIALELINTAIENLADFVSPERNEKIKKVKDLAAGAVLIGAISSLIIGILIFAPKIYGLLLNH